LVFWATWFSVVLASNVTDALAASALLPPSWPFASGNFALVVESVSIYSLSRISAAILFALVLVLELAAAVLFWRAALDREPLSRTAEPRILLPFVVAIALFCGFLVFDEVLLLYRRFPSLETTHFVVLGALLLSLSILRLWRETAGG
jgi:hypothetical protein